MDENKYKIVFCDSSDIYVFRPIYKMLIKGKSINEIKNKVMRKGSSLTEDYFKGAVGLLLCAIEHKLRLVVNPICFKELCIDGDKFHKNNINFLFKTGLFYLAWPYEPYQFSNRVIKGCNKYTNGVGALRRYRQYSKHEHDFVDVDLEDKLSCAENDDFNAHGGYLIRLSDPNLENAKNVHTMEELSPLIKQECSIQKRKTKNMIDYMRATIQLKPKDLMLLPNQVYCHAHRNNSDFGDELTNSKTYYEINGISNIPNYSLGDLYRLSDIIQKEYNLFANGKIEIKRISIPYKVVYDD